MAPYQSQDVGSLGRDVPFVQSLLSVTVTESLQR